MTTLPADVLIVEDDAFIALDLEDQVLRLGVKNARTASNVAGALEMIAKRAPDSALLDVNVHHENSFAIAQKLAILKSPSPSSQAVAATACRAPLLTVHDCQNPARRRSCSWFCSASAGRADRRAQTGSGGVA
jgi:DNA-binding NtrC family response regulator